MKDMRVEVSDASDLSTALSELIKIKPDSDKFIVLDDEDNEFRVSAVTLKDDAYYLEFADKEK